MAKYRRPLFDDDEGGSTVYVVKSNARAILYKAFVLSETYDPCVTHHLPSLPIVHAESESRVSTCRVRDQYRKVVERISTFKYNMN